MHTGSRILLIDDDPIYTKTTRAVLESYGFLVDCAQDGQSGLRMMASEQPDLVLLDVMMSWVLEGVAVSEEMNRQSELLRIPVIMVSSIRSSEFGGLFPDQRYLDIDGWLDKPCAPSQLVSEIEATLSRRDKYRESSQQA